jgi:NitT/TauT family transport system substrate-binding protein
MLASPEAAMNFRAVAPFLVIASLSVRRAGARLIGTQRLDDNGALFLAAAAGYFKAEGIDRAMTTYECDRMVAEALASGTTDFALTGFCGLQFRRQGHDQGDRSANAREASCDLLQLTVRDRAERGTTRAPSSSVPTSGSASQTFEDISARRSRSKRVHTIATEEIDAGIMPASYARDLLASNQAKLVGWYSELDEIQFGVLFASSKMIAIRQSRNSHCVPTRGHRLHGGVAAQGPEFQAYRRRQVARSGDNHFPVCLS